MRVINVSSKKCEYTNKDAVVGIYYKNGIFDEDITRQGISYILDHVLYCMLYDHFSGVGGKTVRCFTNYGYSYFLISCHKNLIEETLREAQSILFFQTLVYNRDDINQWVANRKSIACKSVPVENIYYSKRLPGSPLGRTLSRGLLCNPEHKDLEYWRSKYVNLGQSIAYISGNAEYAVTPNDEHDEELCCLPLLHSCPLAIPNHIPWKYSHMVLSFPYEFHTGNLLATEAFCQLIRPEIAKFANRHQARLSAFQIHTDFVPEFQIHLQCPSGREKWLADHIMGCMLNLEIIDLEQKLFALQGQIKRSYLEIAMNPIEWNSFAGYNTFSRSKYDIDTLTEEKTYAKSISPVAIREIQSDLRGIKDLSVFVTAAR